MSEIDLAPLLAQALENVQRDYPIHWTQTIDGPEDLRPHRELHPMFGGSFDWHSCVHQTWLLVRLLRTRPGLPGEPEAVAVLDRLLTQPHGRTEAAFFLGTRNARWERPYGWAWLLTLDAELRTWGDPRALRWAEALAPLTTVLRDGWLRWISDASRPVRAGVHQNTAFAAGLVLDVARALDDGELFEGTAAAAVRLFTSDEEYGAYEPDAADFLSPALCEADLLRRVLAPEDFASWFAGFLPDLDGVDSQVLRMPVVVEDGSDPQGAHLIGLNLSRAWGWRAIAGALPEDHAYVSLARAAAEAHREAGWRSVFGEGYAATHWVGSFAAYLELGALT
jgi:hypothetical protein